MNMIDTHSHLYVEVFKEDLEEVVARAVEAGVSKVLLPNIDESSISDLRSSVSQFPDILLPMMGLHPTSVKKDWKNQLETIYNELVSNNYIAVGEIGIDLYWDRSLETEQKLAFEEQLRWSIEMDLPVSIHFRNAVKEVIDSINRVGADSLRGVFHSFGGTKDDLEEIMKLKNFMIGVNGVVTFKNSGLTDTLVLCPKDRLVLETDSPYLAPVPFRGKRNESSYLSLIIKKLSDIWDIDEHLIAELTNQNVAKMFGVTIN